MHTRGSILASYPADHLQEEHKKKFRRMPGRKQQQERERKRAAVSCQTLDAFLPAAKQKATADNESASVNSLPVLVDQVDVHAAEADLHDVAKSVVLNVIVPESTAVAELSEGQLSLDIGKLIAACNTDAELFRRINAMSKSDKYAYLRRHSTPPSDFNFPKTFTGGCNRSFRHDWLDQHRWLRYSIELDGAFCMPCVLFNGLSTSTTSRSPARIAGVLVTKPF